MRGRGGKCLFPASPISTLFRDLLFSTNAVKKKVGPPIQTLWE